ncbi:MAG: CapA family protein [Planctomycetota bacterium]
MTTLFLCGDVMTGRGIDQILGHPTAPGLHEPYVKDARQYVRLAEQTSGRIDRPVSGDYIWGFALETLQEIAPEVRIVNLETAVTTSGDSCKGKGIHYRMSPGNLGCLTAAKIDCCTLANNHVLDWGYAGLEETLNSLRQAGLNTAGAGPDLRSARSPALLQSSNGNRIVVFATATLDSGVPPSWAAEEDRPGVALLPHLSEEGFAETARHIAGGRRDESDIVVVSIHWGGNWGYDIPAEQREFAHRLIEEADVDIVHGHSSHHVKGLEVHRDRLILYGCGDLITDYEGISGHETFRGDLSLLYLADVDPETGRLKSLRMQPTQMRQFQLNRPSDRDVSWLHDTLNRQSKQFGASVDLEQDGMLHLRIPS